MACDAAGVSPDAWCGRDRSARDRAWCVLSVDCCLVVVGLAGDARGARAVGARLRFGLGLLIAHVIQGNRHAIGCQETTEEDSGQTYGAALLSGPVARVHVCSEPGCPQLEPCPTPRRTAQRTP